MSSVKVWYRHVDPVMHLIDDKAILSLVVKFIQYEPSHHHTFISYSAKFIMQLGIYILNTTKNISLFSQMKFFCSIGICRRGECSRRRRRGIFNNHSANNNNHNNYFTINNYDNNDNSRTNRNGASSEISKVPRKPYRSSNKRLSDTTGVLANVFTQYAQAVSWNERKCQGSART